MKTKKVSEKNKESMAELQPLNSTELTTIYGGVLCCIYDPNTGKWYLVVRR